MVTNARIGDLIREGKSEEIEDAIADGEFMQMQTFKQALIALAIEGDVDREVAAGAATNRHDFLVALEQEEKRRDYEATKAEEADPDETDEPSEEDAPTFVRAGSAPQPKDVPTGGFKGARQGAVRQDREAETIAQFALRAPESS